jgi:hypothetical protein
MEYLQYQKEESILRAKGFLRESGEAPSLSSLNGQAVAIFNIFRSGLPLPWEVLKEVFGIEEEREVLWRLFLLWEEGR